MPPQSNIPGPSMPPAPQPLPQPLPRPPLPPPAPHQSSVLKWVIIAIAVIVLLGGAVAAGYFMRSPQVSDQQGEPTGTEQKNTNNSSNDTTNADAAQVRNRDTERASDINSVATQLEVYYNDNAAYPTFAQLSDDSWVKANLLGIDLEALRAPDATANSLIASATPDQDHYGYEALNTDYSACNSNQCAKFKLYWYRESTSKVTTKDSLN